MSQMAVQGYRAEREALLEIAQSLSEEELAQPSDCAGWAVRDVIAHLAASIHGVVDPAFLPDMAGGAEAAMEAPVAERRSWGFAQVLEEYATFSEQAAAAFEAFQVEPLSETMLPMGELGTHPMRILPATFLFDTYCHLRIDILGLGPIDRPEPPRDEERLKPTVDWMLAGLPWMCRDGLVVVDHPLDLVLDGPGGGRFGIIPGGEDGRVLVVDDGAAYPTAEAFSDTHDFVIWGTQRRPWRDYVRIDGQADYAATVLDVINII